MVAPLDENDPQPSCRNADAPYHEGQLLLTVDGFLVSDNVTVTGSLVYDTGFAYSDHQPVVMTFTPVSYTHLVSGRCVRCMTVPAVTEVWYRHARRWNPFRPRNG